MLAPATSTPSAEDVNSFVSSSYGSWMSSPRSSLGEPISSELDGARTITPDYSPEENVEMTTSGAIEGCGLRAKRFFARYELIFVERPLLEFNQFEDIDLVVEDNLSAEDRRAFFQLSDSCSDLMAAEQQEEAERAAAAAAAAAARRERTASDADAATKRPRNRRQTSTGTLASKASATSLDEENSNVKNARRRSKKGSRQRKRADSRGSAGVRSRKKTAPRAKPRTNSSASNSTVTTSEDEDNRARRRNARREQKQRRPKPVSRKSSTESKPATAIDDSEDVNTVCKSNNNNNNNSKNSKPTTTTTTTTSNHADTKETQASADAPAHVKTPMGVCQTNAFSLGEELFAVLCFGARINHSCQPNIGYRFEETTREIHFYALRDISVGEELCLSYIDQSIPRDERRSMLRQRYGFTCMCPGCDLNEKELAEAEFRRERLASTDKSIFEAIETFRYDEALLIVEERLALLYEEQGLSTPLLLLRTEYDALFICEKTEDVEGMSHWIRAATEHARIAHGRHSSIYAQLRNKAGDIHILEQISKFC